MAEYQITKIKRLKLSTSDKDIAETWGYGSGGRRSDWSRMRKEANKHETIHLIFGDWSGYNSSQYRFTHCAFISRSEMKGYEIDKNWRAYHKFSDNTGMKIWIKEMTIPELLGSKQRRINGYGKLIGEYLRREIEP